MKYSLMKPDEQAKFARGLAIKLKESLKGGGTAEQAVATVAQLVRTIGSSELVNDISDAEDKNGQILDGGLREWLIEDYSGLWGFGDSGDEADILNAFGYAADSWNPWGTSEQELEAQSAGKLVGRSNFALFGNKGSTPQNIPEFTGEYYLWDEREGEIPTWWDIGPGYDP